LRLEDTENFVSGDEADLGDTMRVTKGDANLGGGKTLAGEFHDLVDDLFGGGLEPGRGGPAIREGRGRCKS
jgi:hypothetical protein